MVDTAGDTLDSIRSGDHLGGEDRAGGGRGRRGRIGRGRRGRGRRGRRNEEWKKRGKDINLAILASSTYYHSSQNSMTFAP